MSNMPISELNLLPIFSFADEFPYISDEEMLELAQDIEENGMHHPIVLFNATDAETGEITTQVLDGRNRLRALAKTNLTDAPVETYEGDDPIGYVFSINVARRHLTTGQRALLAVAALPYYEAQAAIRRKAIAMANLPNIPADEKRTDLVGLGKSTAQVAEKFGTSGSAVMKAKALSTSVYPELLVSVKDGSATLESAYQEMQRRQDSTGHSGQTVKPDNPVEIFQNIIDSAYNRMIDAVQALGSTGNKDDVDYIRGRLNKVLAVAEKTFSG